MIWEWWDWFSVEKEVSASWKNHFPDHKNYVCYMLLKHHDATALDVFLSLKTEDKAKKEIECSSIKESMKYSILGMERESDDRKDASFI